MRRGWIWAVLLLLLGLAVPVRADSPVPPSPYVKAAGAYRFVMLAPGDPPPQTAGGQPYPASGLYRDDGSLAPLWTVDWYALPDAVFLLADGHHCARLGPWPVQDQFDELAVGFYRDGSLLASYRVRDLVGDPAALPRSVSHYQWLQSQSFDPAAGVLTLSTLEGQTYRFDLRTGQVVPEPAAAPAPMPVPLPLGRDAVLACIAAVILALVAGWRLFARRQS